MSGLRQYIGLGATRGSVLLHLGAIVILSVLASFYFMGPDVARTPANIAAGMFFSFVIWFTQWVGNGYIIYRLDKHIPWINKPKQRLLIGFFSLVAYSTAAILTVAIVLQLLFIGELPANPRDWALCNVREAVLISLFISTVLSAAGFLRNWREEAVRAMRLETELAANQYAVLRNQINPHFLFNSLNVLSELVYEEPEIAVKFIRQLSDVYRYVIDSRNKDLVPLEEELEFIQSYIFLLNIRFGDKVKVQISGHASEEKGVIPMALQVLIENAVKHNETSNRNPLLVDVVINDSELIVRNAILPKQTSEEASGSGLENIVGRYAYFTSQPVAIQKENGFFTVAIPLINLVVK